MGYVKYKKSVLRTLSKRAYLVVALFIVVIASTIVFIAFEGYGASDALYNVLCTVSWGHCSEAYTWPARLASLLLALSTWTALAVIMESGVESFMKLEFGGKKLKKMIDQLKNHVIVCGYGSLGKTVCEAIENEGVEFVVIDQDPRVVAKLKDAGVPVIEGNALEVKTLKEAGVEKARLVVSALSTDADNVFLALTAKESNPNVSIATRAYTEGAIAKLHRAGADIIVMPEIIGGLELAKEALNLEESHIQRLVSKRGTFNPKKLPANPKYEEASKK